ncbi:MAG: hypothetical protein GPJ54_06205 [Candidatus Heimdallarchaeota archaeon]|nr:hypothetical protein [Candidatus Heimdallarchaeota archaeon]
MSVTMKKEIQQMTSDDVEIKPVDKKSVKNDHNKDFFNNRTRIWNKINIEIVSVMFIRLIIVTVTGITLMQLERTL